jgi:hypothetical protein
MDSAFAAHAGAAMDPHQQHQQQYAPYDQQQYYYDAQSAAQQYGGGGEAQYNDYNAHQYVAQYEQYNAYQQQQPGSKVRLSTRSASLAAAAGSGGYGGDQAAASKPRYNASGRPMRAASKGLARLIAEEGGVPQDHSLAAPPTHSAPRCVCACVWCCCCCWR